MCCRCSLLRCNVVKSEQKEEKVDEELELEEGHEGEARELDACRMKAGSVVEPANQGRFLRLPSAVSGVRPVVFIGDRS